MAHTRRRFQLHVRTAFQVPQSKQPSTDVLSTSHPKMYGMFPCGLNLNKHSVRTRTALAYPPLVRLPVKGGTMGVRWNMDLGPGDISFHVRMIKHDFMFEHHSKASKPIWPEEQPTFSEWQMHCIHSQGQTYGNVRHRVYVIVSRLKTCPAESGIAGVDLEQHVSILLSCTG